MQNRPSFLSQQEMLHPSPLGQRHAAVWQMPVPERYLPSLADACKQAAVNQGNLEPCSQEYCCAGTLVL